MPTTTKLVEHLPRHLVRIAKRIEQRRRELNLTQQALADRCTKTRTKLFGPDELGLVPKMTRERIAKILMVRNHLRRGSAAKALYPHELQLLAHVLDVPTEWLEGPEAERPIVLWDPVANPRRASHIIHLITHHEKDATEYMGWAEFLPCEFVLPELMRAHHAAIFGAADGIVRFDDAVGRAKRERPALCCPAGCSAVLERILAVGRPRSWTFTHCMFLSDLRRIATAEGEHHGFSTALRRECFQHLVQLLSDPAARLRLVVAEDDDDPGLRLQLRDFDSLFITGSTLAMWRDHTGNLLWSEHPRTVAAKRAVIEAFRRQATYRDAADVIGLLRRLLRRIKSTPRRGAASRR